MATQTGSIDLKAATKAHDEASKVATNFIADFANGILVHPEENDGSGVQITDIIQILSDSQVVATYGASVTIGNSLGKHIAIDSNGLTMWSGDESNPDNKVAWFSDNQLHIPNAVVTDNLITGLWKWESSSTDNRLNLKYLG